jgi:hypothetical protein
MVSPVTGLFSASTLDGKHSSGSDERLPSWRQTLSHTAWKRKAGSAAAFICSEVCGFPTVSDGVGRAHRQSPGYRPFARLGRVRIRPQGYYESIRHLRPPAHDSRRLPSTCTVWGKTSSVDKRFANPLALWRQRADDVRGEALPEEAPDQVLDWFLRFFAG